MWPDWDRSIQSTWDTRMANGRTSVFHTLPLRAYDPELEHKRLKNPRLPRIEVTLEGVIFCACARE